MYLDKKTFMIFISMFQKQQFAKVIGTILICSVVIKLNRLCSLRVSTFYWCRLVPLRNYSLPVGARRLCIVLTTSWWYVVAYTAALWSEEWLDSRCRGTVSLETLSTSPVAWNPLENVRTHHLHRTVRPCLFIEPAKCIVHRRFASFITWRSRVGRLSLIHIWRCRRSTLCRSRWSPYH